MATGGDVNDTTEPNIDLGIAGYEDPVLVGRGGFGMVYRAYQPDLSRTVAIKIIPVAGLDRAAQRRFVRERQAMGTLSTHPAIVTVHESGTTASGLPYLVMEYMENGSVGDRLATTGALPWRQAADMAAAVASALKAAHEAGVLHRDVKPENILISRYDEVKLSDFGIASLREGTTSTAGSISATIAYAAPEILQGAQPSERSDVYSLGSTLFALLAGGPAFQLPTDGSLLPIITRVLTEPIPDLRPLGVPEPVVRVVERAMAKSPDERYASAAAFRSALVGAVDTMPAPVDETRPISIHPTETELIVAAPASGASPPPATNPLPGADHRDDDPPTAPMELEPGAVMLAEEPKPPRRKRRAFIIAAAAFALVGLAVAIPLALQNSDDDGRAVGAGPTAAATTTTPTTTTTTSPRPEPTTIQGVSTTTTRATTTSTTTMATTTTRAATTTTATTAAPTTTSTVATTTTTAATTTTTSGDTTPPFLSLFSWGEGEPIREFPCTLETCPAECQDGGASTATTQQANATDESGIQSVTWRAVAGATTFTGTMTRSTAAGYEDWFLDDIGLFPPSSVGPGGGTIVVTVTATDNAGNSASDTMSYPLLDCGD